MFCRGIAVVVHNAISPQTQTPHVNFSLFILEQRCLRLYDCFKDAMLDSCVKAFSPTL